MVHLLKSKKFQLGFTLAELLIAVAIIVILITIGTVSYSTINSKARDAQRKSDMASIQQALEAFLADRGSYPDEGYKRPAASWLGYDSISCEIDTTTTADVPVGLAPGEPFVCNGITYMSKYPGDPTRKNTAGDPLGYYYEINEMNFYPSPDVPVWCENGYGKNCRTYTLWAHLENGGILILQKPTTTQFVQLQGPLQLQARTQTPTACMIS